MPLTVDTAQLEELLRLGFLRYGPSDYPIGNLQRHVAEYGPEGLLEPDATGRAFHLDAEDLAEGSADIALSEMEQVLAENGVSIGTPRVDYHAEQDQTVLLVSDRWMTLCQWPLGDDESTWELFSRAFFSLVNHLLASARSPERLYAMHPYTNDLGGIFLTQPLYEKLCAMKIGSFHLIEDQVRVSSLLAHPIENFSDNA